MITHPVCIDCCLSMSPYKNEAALVFNRGSSAAFVVEADLFICDECGHIVASGFAPEPLARASRLFEMMLSSLESAEALYEIKGERLATTPRKPD